MRATAARARNPRRTRTRTRADRATTDLRGIATRHRGQRLFEPVFVRAIQFIPQRFSSYHIKFHFKDAIGLESQPSVARDAFSESAFASLGAQYYNERHRASGGGNFIQKHGPTLTANTSTLT